ncbi:dienelactone hydrolase family protein [Actinoplanes sp. CA-142083]|uniref:dienelactone hydrolase family protein n=1 Tax=Actinoplanes sp. CA-142083 TaxID=3239903 RepID=UPI003D91D5A9
MRHIALFHSVYGRRPAILEAAELFRAAGHEVTAPDLFGGPVAESLEEGFAISERTGWAAIMRRAREAVQDLPPDTVLAGLSMGAGVVGDLLAERPGTAGVLLLHGFGGDPRRVSTGLPVQVHVGQADTMFPPAKVAAWQAAMAAGGATVEVFTYPDILHFFTDSGVDDYDAEAARLAWERSLRFVGAL